MSGRIVIIDDDPEVRVLLGRVLMRAGYDVAVAADGVSGLAAIDETVTCLVVDKMLPGLGGLEVMAEARGRLPALPVVLVTAHPEPLSLGDARPDVVLPKPFESLGVIVEAVRAAVEARRAAAPRGLRERVAAVVAEIAPVRRKRE